MQSYNLFLAKILAAFPENTKDQVIVQLNYDRMPLSSLIFPFCKRLIGQSSNPIFSSGVSNAGLHFCGYDAIIDWLPSCDYLIATDVKPEDPWIDVVSAMKNIASKFVPTYIAIESAMVYQKHKQAIIAGMRKALSDERYDDVTKIRYEAEGETDESLDRLILFMRKLWTF